MNSSAIKRVAHDPETRKLRVEFHGKGKSPGRVAEYENVGADKHAALMASESKGRHFAIHIKGSRQHSWRYL